MCGVFGVVAPGGDAARLAARGPLRPAAPGPGVGRDRRLGRRPAHALQGPRPHRPGPRRAAPARASPASSRSPTAATPRPGPRSGRTPSRRSAWGRGGRWRSGTTATSSTRASSSSASPGGRSRLPASTDTELLTALLADEPASDTVEALVRVLPRVRGAYSLVVLDERRLIGVRDPHGFRPLVLGRLPAAPDTPGLVGRRRRGRRLGPLVRDGRPRRRRRRLRPRRGAGRARRPGARGRRPARSASRGRDAGPLRLRAHLLRPARIR